MCKKHTTESEKKAPITKVVHEDPKRRFKLREDPRTPKRPYQLSFFAKWVSEVDPARCIPDLKRRLTFKTITDGKKKALSIIQNITADGASLSSFGELERSQLLNLASQLKEAGENSSKILQESLNIAKKDLCPIKSLKVGSSVVEKSENFIGKTFGYFIDLFEKDPVEAKNKTHSATISNLRSLEHLSEIKFETLYSTEKTLKQLKQVFQAYSDRPDVKRMHSLHHCRRKVRQLLTFIQTTTYLPTEDTLSIVANFKKLRLDIDLLPQRPIYALRASELLLLIKYLSRTESFEPCLPIICGWMGQRVDMFPEFTWEMVLSSNNKGEDLVTIPWELTKLGKQKRHTQDIVFSHKQIPNFSQWISYCKNLWIKSGRKPKGKLANFELHARGRHLNRCIEKYQHLFDFKVEPEDTLRWDNVCKNSFRNCFFSMALKHPKIGDEACRIGNDYKNTDRYIDTTITNRSSEAEALYSMTPDFLDLVDLDKGVIDTEFINTDNKDREIMCEIEEDPKKKQIYERCLGLVAPF